MTDRPLLRCPHCRAPLAHAPTTTAPCPSCGTTIECIDGAPVLLADAAATAAAIAYAGARRPRWYDDPQDRPQLTGPYRHAYARRRRYLDSVLAGWDRPADSVGIDVGCGDGFNLGWLGQHVRTVAGSDYNALRAGRAAARDIGTVFVADLLDYPVLDGAADLVVCNHVLEHIPDDLGALRELRRVLAPGGLAIIGTPNEAAAFWQLAYRLQPSSRRTTDHVQFYDAASLRARCEAAGFEVIHVEPIGWGLPHWTLDAAVRQFRVADDVLERLGRRFLPSQATSLYVLARNPGDGGR